MTELIDSGSWVEIHALVLAAGERAPQVPADTQEVALEMRVKGFLCAPARIGDEAQVETVAGRRLHGTLAALAPPYEHGFGPPLAELSAIGPELRRLLRPTDQR